jgi:hypothetical protein
VRFEALLEAWFRFQYSPEVLLRNVRVPRTPRETLGELDLVFAPGSDGAPADHWELSVKFYLCMAAAPEAAERESAFVGLMLRDRLDLKLRQLREKQVPLGQHPLALATLAERGVPAPRSRALVKGMLFYPVAWKQEAVQLPSSVHPGHRRGSWCLASELQEVEERFAPGASLAAWYPLPKERWLVSPQGVSPGALVSRREVPSCLRAGAGMFSLLAQEKGGAFRELRRVVVVEESWMARARAAQAEWEAGTASSARTQP